MRFTGGMEAVVIKIQKAFDILGKKWSGLVLYSLLGDPMRFTDIRRNIPELSDRVLAERLRELEQLQLVKRNVYTRIPVKIEYELTKKGKELEKTMREIEIWAENNL
jgi:DNA-binding HxlR family transcriptional regulator